MPKYPYRQIGVSLNRDFRNDQNQNLKDIESDIKEQKARVDAQISGVEQPSEVVDARVDGDGTTYGNLRDRLNGKDADVASQLADTASQLADNEQQLGTQLIDINRGRLYRLLVTANRLHQTVVVIGDSITEGTVNNGHGWFEYLSHYFPDINFVNKGVGGNGTIDVINRMDDILSVAADLYIIAIGTNDVRYQDSAHGALTPDDFAANVETICSQLTKPIVVIEPWPAFNGDYTSVLGYARRDSRMRAYSAAEEQYCVQNEIPFIKVFDDLKGGVDFVNKSSLYVDYIHPNYPLGVQYYSEEVLFGNRSAQDYGIAKTPTSATVHYVYKLVIHKAFQANDQFDLMRLTTDKATTAGSVYTTSINNGKDDISQILNHANTEYHFQNKSGEFPVIITFQTEEPIYYLRQYVWDGGYGIGKYDLYECTEVYDSWSPVLDFGSNKWRLIAHETRGIGNKADTAPVFLYNARRFAGPIVFDDGWTINDSEINNQKTEGDWAWICWNMIKSSAIVPGEEIGVVPDELKPINSINIPCILFGDTSMDMSFLTLQPNGKIFITNKKENSAGYTKVQATAAYPIQ